MSSLDLSTQRRRAVNAYLNDFWREIVARSDPKRRCQLVAVTWTLVFVIGVVDFLTGFEASWLVFYLVPVCLAVTALGWRFGVVTAVASVGLWLAGDFAAGAHYANPLLPCWNAAVALVTYLVVIWLFAAAQTLQRDLEERVQQRTAALTAEVAERERLGKAILEISERERRSIGHDLHDGLGQHLTGTALTGQLLAEKLQERAAEETADAKKVVTLVKKAIEQTHQMAKGLLLADIDADGLTSALQEFCITTAEQFRVDCVFRCEGNVSLVEGGLATHLYRIAQEAVRNAIRHGQARHIEVGLLVVDRHVVLTVRDDGVGLPPPDRHGRGLGLRIMAHRAKMIGAVFAIETPPEGGTVIVCNLPSSAV